MTAGKDYDYLFKLILIGNSGVGKSSLLLRFSDNNFGDSYIPTIGVDFRFRNVTIENKNIKLQIWDTAGQERFRTITTTYYRSANGIVLCYDTTDLKSFSDLESWMEEINQYANNPVIILVGTKADMKVEEDKKISEKDIQDFINKYDMEHIETSSKTAINTDAVFLALARKLMTSYMEGGNKIIKKSPSLSKQSCCQI